MQDDLFKKNIEMWEQFTANYMDNMFKTVEQAMEQSQALQGQVNKAVQNAVETQMDATLSMLKAMQRQLEILSEKVDQLMEK